MSRNTLLTTIFSSIVALVCCSANADELADLRRDKLALTKLVDQLKTEVENLREQVDRSARTSFQVALPNGQPVANVPVHEGVWKVVSASFCGNHFPADVLRDWSIKIDGNKYTHRTKGNDQAASGTVTIDKDSTPKRMTIRLTEGKGKGKTVNAIYEIRNKNVLILCYSYHGEEDTFPQDFKSAVNPPTHLTVFLRETQRAGP